MRSPPGQGQLGENACREQLITRQPSAANFLTVAWPIPRLAPVSRSVRGEDDSVMDPTLGAVDAQREGENEGHRIVAKNAATLGWSHAQIFGAPFWIFGPIRASNISCVTA